MADTGVEKIVTEKRDDRIKAASEALRIHFSNLSVLLKTSPLTISVKLYSSKIFSREEFDKIRSASSSDMEKAIDIISSVTDHIKVDPDVFNVFCKILESDSTTESQAKALQGTRYIKFLLCSGGGGGGSVHLRTVSALLACARLATTYCACLWSIRACTVTSPNSSHIQATAARPHGCKNRAKYVSQRVPTLFSGGGGSFTS